MTAAPLQRLLTAAVAGALAIPLLTSCTGQTDLDEGVAAQLQTRVATAKQLAAEQDASAALAELGQLSQEVATAAGQGRMSQQRKSRIDAAIGTIRTDLEATLAPVPTPETPATAPQLTEDQQEQVEEARKQAEEARKEAEEQREKAQKEAQEQREKAQKEAEKQRDNR